MAMLFYQTPQELKIKGIEQEGKLFINSDCSRYGVYHQTSSFDVVCALWEKKLSKKKKKTTNHKQQTKTKQISSLHSGFGPV